MLQPLILAGQTVITIVAPHIARLLISKGLAKTAGSIASKVHKGRKTVNNLDDLPPTILKKWKESEVPLPKVAKPVRKPRKPMSQEAIQRGIKTRQKRLAEKGRTQKEEARHQRGLQSKKKKEQDKLDRQQDRELKRKRKADYNERYKKEMAEREAKKRTKPWTKQEKISYGKSMKKERQGIDKLEVQENLVTPTRVPKGQKGMLLPGKGETIKRKKGGSVKKPRGWGKARYTKK